MEPLTPEAIRDVRQRLGLTQVQLAEWIGCTPIAVSYWERGTRTPTGLYARAVQAVLAEAEAVPEVREAKTIMPLPPVA